MVYPKDATKAAIDVKARLSQKYRITTLRPPHQFLGIEIHHQERETGTGINRGHYAVITTIFKRFKTQNAHYVSTPRDAHAMLDLAEDRGEEELKDIQGYQAIVRSLKYVALSTRPDISFAVVALRR
jgi:hypothetical protein